MGFLLAPIKKMTKSKQSPQNYFEFIIAERAKLASQSPEELVSEIIRLKGELKQSDKNYKNAVKAFEMEKDKLKNIKLELFRDISDRKRIEAELQKSHDALSERIKEINCLYSIFNLAEKMGISIDEILQGTLEIIPYAWQYPSITGAKIVVDGQELKTALFQNTAWSQNSDIVIKGQKIGSVEVCYLEEKPERDEGPFLREERDLLNTIGIQ